MEVGGEEVDKDLESKFYNRYSSRSASKINNTSINRSTGRAILGGKPKNTFDIIKHLFISDEGMLSLGLGSTVAILLEGITGRGSEPLLVQRHVPLSENDRVPMGWLRSNVCCSAPDLASHRLMVSSLDPDASILPSGEKATALI
jgi:hypothetical protein